MFISAETTSSSRRAAWLLLVFLLGLIASLFVMALVEGSFRQATRGIGPSLPGPVLGASVSPLCVNVALQTYADPAGTALKRTLDSIGGAGFTWVRQTFPWAAIETAPGVYDWAAWDAVVQAVSDHPDDLQLIAVLDTAPAWATAQREGPWDATPPTDPADLARFAAALASRYGDRIDVYQIWDEPNLSSHWGGRDVDPAGYAAILRAAAEAIRKTDADGQATILLAGLAPTTETGPRNLSDVRYLRALYELGAALSFDIAAGKPYGFDAAPDDRRLDEAALNFSRLVLLREIMVEHGDGDKALWASHWGWNALPRGWAGTPSIWGQTDAATQAARTVAALERAQREWPWVGALCLEVWQPDVEDDDPHWGFAIIGADGQPRPVYDAVEAWSDSSLPAANPPGYYAAGVQGAADALPGAANGVADFQGDWRFSELGADVTDTGGQSVAIPFRGTDLGLHVRRGDYRAYLYVTIDGQPANALPTDENSAYVVLSSPEGQPQETIVPVARGLDDGFHVAQVTVERGWGQWPLVGWSVGWWPHADEQDRRWLFVATGLVAMICLAGMVWTARRVRWRWASGALTATWKGLGDAAKVGVAAAVTVTFWASAWLSWGHDHSAGLGGLMAALAAATLYYISPVFIVSLLSLALLGVFIVLRIDLGLALVAFAAPFYLQSRPMFDRAFSIAEVALLLCLVSWVVHRIPKARSHLTRRPYASSEGPSSNFLNAPLALDWAMLAFVAVGFFSLLAAEIRGVALRELRVIVLEPALFYLILRSTPLKHSSRWRIVDAFVLGAIVVAAVGLYQYAFTAEVITAEAGLRRLKSVYGSPNNVGLYLGRVLPVLIAVVLFGRQRTRRWLYGAGTVLVGLALVLSFSKGALLFGVPASVLALGLLAGGRWVWASIGLLGAAALAAIPILRTPRFTSVFDLQSGTSFFRLNLWRSSVDMIRDHPVIGVGLDNFLYAYRGRYIRPAAWQEPNLSHPHNVVLDYASRLGALGLATAVWIQIAFWRLALPLRRLTDPDERALALGLMASMVDFVAHGLVDNSYFLVDLAFAFCLVLGLVVHLAGLLKEEVTRAPAATAVHNTSSALASAPK